MARMQFLALALMIAMSAIPALAQPRDGGKPLPAFTAAERQYIEGNPALAAAVDIDPWTVRRILDRIAEHETAAAGAASERPGERASPEALSDLFDILKQAGAKGQKK